MRDILNRQLTLTQPFIAHPHGAELAHMSEILDALPDDVLAAVHQDLVRGRGDRGRRGLSADQVIRAFVIKQLNGFNYSELAFHLADSTCYRAFCRFGITDRVPSRSALQLNIKRLTPTTLEPLNIALVRYAASTGIESGAKVRVDCTNVESHIHHPTDSSLLWDVVRVLTRLMARAKTLVAVSFVDHQRRAKRRMHDIRNAKRREQRVPLYRDLITVTESTLSDASTAVKELERHAGADPSVSVSVDRLVTELRKFVELGERVVSQTRQRVLEGKQVPASDKVLSIFEPHTDLLVKGPREPEYGHKICLSTGASGLVLDGIVLDGNPADVTLTTRMVSRHKERYSVAPTQTAFDGAFASRANLETLKSEGVVDVMFSKRCGLPLTEMARSSWTYKRLRDFRAGIEGCISFLKRCFGLTRCTWSGFESFTSYVWGSIVSSNLLLMARHRIARAAA